MTDPKTNLAMCLSLIGGYLICMAVGVVGGCLLGDALIKWRNRNAAAADLVSTNDMPRTNYQTTNGFWITNSTPAARGHQVNLGAGAWENGDGKTNTVTTIRVYELPIEGTVNRKLIVEKSIAGQAWREIFSYTNTP